MVDDDAIILLAWDAVSSDAALVTLLETLAAAFGCRSAALVYKDMLTPAADITVAYGPFADVAVQRRYALEYAALDPAPAALGRLRLGEVADTDALFPLGDREPFRAFLDGFYHPLGLAGAIGAPLSKGETRIGMVAVHRDMARPPFDATDADRLRRLVPHLARMIALRQVFFALDEKAARRGEALEPLAAATMIVDAAGVLIEANALARTLFARRDGLVLTRSGAVGAREAGAAAALRDAFRASADSLVRVPRAGGGAYVLRLRRRTDPQGWVVMASDPAGEACATPEALAAALGLTAAGANLVIGLLDGETLATFCARRGMSRNTAKYHLSAAFAATGTRRQADLLRHASAVVRDLAL